MLLDTKNGERVRTKSSIYRKTMFQVDTITELKLLDYDYGGWRNVFCLYKTSR